MLAKQIKICFNKSMAVDEAYKNKIGERLTKRIADALRGQEISQEEAANISSYILENIDKVEDNVQLVDFLTDLSQKWPIFSSILTTEQAEATQDKAKEAVEQVSGLIKENKIDEAIKVAETATAQKTGG